MNAHEARRLEQIRCAHAFRPEAQMRDRVRAGFLGVVYEVALRMPSRVGGEDFYRILVRSDGAVSPQPVEERAHDIGRLDVECRLVLEARMRNIVDDADRKAVLRLGFLELIEDRLCHGWIEILR